MCPASVHPTAIVEDGVRLGDRTIVWDQVHIRGPASIGSECIIGGKSYIAYGVEVGDRVKINSFVYICTGVSIEDAVMVSAGVVFTNDRFPRATTPDLVQLRGSGPDENTQRTRVLRGATLGAQATIGSDLTIGRFAVVGMGAVVTRNVHDFQLVLGNPARPAGYVCRCGRPHSRFAADAAPVELSYECMDCGFGYQLILGEIRETRA